MDIIVTANLRDDIKADLTDKYKQLNWSFIRDLSQLDSGVAERAEAIVTFGGDITDDLLEQLPALRWIQVLSAGVEGLPFDTLKSRQISVTNARGIHAIPMAEFAMGLMLQEVKQFTAMHEQQKTKVWNKKLSFGECFGKTVAIVGTGAIGTAIANLSRALGMKTIGVNRNGGAREGFDEIILQNQVIQAFQQSDFVIVVAPLTEETNQWLDYSLLSNLRPDSIFINLGRGDIVVEKDLIRLLQEEKIKKAYLDVFQVEPLSEDSPLWSMDRCVITPHVSAITPQYIDRSVVILTDNLERFQKQENLINLIDLEARY